MKKLFIAVIILLLVLFGIFYFSSYSLTAEENKLFQACIKNSCFNVEIADTESERAIGLMSRAFLNEDSGMLFIFPSSGIHPFWMKNTLIPLDIIWINNNEIVYIKENAQPCKIENCKIISPSQVSDKVLEINSGKVRELGIKVRDKIQVL